VSTESANLTLDQAAAERSLRPLWDIYDKLVAYEPRPACQPALWRYRDVRPLLARAAREISTAIAERRVLLFKNPGLERPFTTHTLGCGLQLLLPGEIEGSHRHSQAALRLVVEGDGAYTTTDGERIWMKPGDVITTPSWTWHDHGKTTDGEMVWLDGIDVPLVEFLRATFRESAPGGGERRQALTRPDSDSHFRYGCGLLPLDPLPASLHSPVYAYPYERTRDVLEALRRASEWDPCHGIKLKFSNPLSGEHVMPTIAACMQLLPRGFETASYRSTDAAIFSVVEGSGTVWIAEQSFAWEAGDVFVVPNWTGYRFATAADAVLFSFSDRAAQERLGLWREDRSTSSAGGASNSRATGARR